MIDIHAHILPGVDDGPMTMEESIQLIEHAIDEGITEIIVTPHSYNPHFDVQKELVLEKLKLVKAEISKRELPMILHAGQEIRIQEDSGLMLETAQALTLGNSKYVLLELPTATIPMYTVKVIQDILNLNKIPIIAHPERNRAIAENPDRLKRLITNGALSQITAGSLAGHFGKNVQKLSLKLVEANLVHAYGSDVHNVETRPFLFEKGLDYLDKNKLSYHVDIFLENNARIVTNEEFILLEPNSVGKNKWWQNIL